MATSPTFETQSSSFEPIPVNGPTAQGMNEANAQRMPQSQFDFAIRKGVSNTAKQAINAGMKKKVDREIKSEMQKLLAKQEVGAKQLRDSAVKTYGEEIDEMLPPVDLFYDQKTGAFMPYKYAQAVTVGVQEFKKQKASADKAAEAKAKEDRTMQGKQELQGYAAGFKGTTSEEFKQGATQLSSFGSGALEGSDINTAAGGYPSAAKPKDPLTEQKFRFQQYKFRYSKAQDKAAVIKEIRDDLDDDLTAVDKRKLDEGKILTKLEHPISIVGAPEEPDTDAVSKQMAVIRKIDNEILTLKNAIKDTYIAEEKAASGGKPTTALFHDPGGDTSSLTTPSQIGPAAPAAGSGGASPTITGVDPLRQAAIEFLQRQVPPIPATPENVDKAIRAHKAQNQSQ